MLVLAFASCASSALDPFPAEFVYLAAIHPTSKDLSKSLCRKYVVVDKEKVQLKFMSEEPLAPGGNCDRVVGFHRSEFKGVQNWIRDTIEDFKEKLEEIQNLMDQNQQLQDIIIERQI